MTDERLFELKHFAAEAYRVDDRIDPLKLGEALDEIDRLRAERKPSDKSVDRMLAEAIEAETDWNSPSCRVLRAIAHEVLQERIANGGKLHLPAPPRARPLAEVEHLLYALIRDELPAREVRELVDEARSAVEMGGILMAEHEGKLAAELALHLCGKAASDG